jgi:hypothetical protein
MEVNGVKCKLNAILVRLCFDFTRHKRTITEQDKHFIVMYTQTHNLNILVMEVIKNKLLNELLILVFVNRNRFMSNYKSLAPVSHAVGKCVYFLLNCCLVVHNEAVLIGQDQNRLTNAQIRVVTKIVIHTELFTLEFLLGLFDIEVLLFDILLQFVGSEGLFAQNCHNQVLGVGIEHNLREVFIFLALNLYLSLTFSSFRVPKGKYSFSIYILIG